MPFERIAIVDHHCHSLLRDGPADVAALRACFSESTDERLLRDHQGTSLFYRRAVRDLAAFYGAADETALAARLAERAPVERARALFADANFEALLIDVGYRPDEYLSLEELGALVPVRPVLRLERVAEDLVPHAADADDLLARLLAHLREARGAGYVGVKTVLAYRTGLEIRRHGEADVARAFAEVREAALRGPRLRLASRPLLDTLVWEACREAGRLGLAVQVHCGFGDSDLRLPDADPSRLKPLLEDPGCRETRFVLLHCHPFVQEAAWLASVYGQVHLDLSLTIPMLAHGAADAVRAALAHAPFSKVLLATDAFSTPELYWVAARAMREALGRALDAIRAEGFLEAREIDEVARALLADNARRVYGLS